MSNAQQSVAQNPDCMHLRLFIAGFSAQSQRAIDRLRALCQEHLHDKYQLEIIDIYQQPDLARQNQIIATPTLIKNHPQPKKLMVGDFTRSDRFLISLGIAS